MTVSQVVTDNILYEPATEVFHLRNVCYDHGTFRLGNCSVTNVAGEPVRVLQVISTETIRSNGNCLFSSLRNILCGSLTFSCTMRNKICTTMEKAIPYADILKVTVNQAYKTVENYLNFERMREEGTFADLEVIIEANTFALFFDSPFLFSRSSMVLG